MLKNGSSWIKVVTHINKLFDEGVRLIDPAIHLSNIPVPKGSLSAYLSTLTSAGYLTYDSAAKTRTIAMKIPESLSSSKCAYNARNNNRVEKNIKRYGSSGGLYRVPPKEIKEDPKPTKADLYKDEPVVAKTEVVTATPDPKDIQLPLGNTIQNIPGRF